MGDDDWDLHAVVRGCAAATNSTAVTPSSNNPLPIFQPLLSHEDDPIPFDFPNIPGDRKDTLQGLQDIYQQFCFDAMPPTAIPAAATCGSASVTEGQIFQPHQGIVQAQPPFQMNKQFQESIHYMNIGLGGSSSHYFPATNPQPSRPRRRKNQQMKIVHQMTQEELSADSWAWRKYGQKPIKGSSYPRNYYRCSTSKGCAARRQVERSPNDSGMFVVSYTGEHTHPRPAHRSSLAGSARCKFATAAANKDGNNRNAMLFQKGSISSSPASASGSSWSPRTPLVEREAAARNDDVEMAEEEDGGGDEDEENRIMSPSDLMNGDDGEQSSGGGDLFTSGLLSSPPWTSTSSAATWRR